jgi:hypothetical protein
LLRRVPVRAGLVVAGAALIVAAEALASFDRDVTIWDAATGRPRGEVVGRTAPASAVAFAPGGGPLAAGVGQGAVALL